MKPVGGRLLRKNTGQRFLSLIRLPPRMWPSLAWARLLLFHKARMKHTVAVDEDKVVAVGSANGVVEGFVFLPTLVGLSDMLPGQVERVGCQEGLHVRVLGVLGNNEVNVTTGLTPDRIQYHLQEIGVVVNRDERSMGYG